MTDATNLEAMQRADEAAAVRGVISGFVNEQVWACLNHLVANYRGGTLSHDTMLGKVAEISALTSLVDALDGSMRAGETAREKEFGNGTKTPPSPGTRSRSKST